MGSKNSTLIVMCLFLATLVIGIYFRTADYPFVNLDDHSYVTQNPYVSGGLTAGNIWWAFTAVHSSNWHPVTWLSHMLDVQLYGLNPRGHHLTNVIIHALSSVLLLLFLFRQTGALWCSSLVAALFALHPLHVESVAWIAERKDLLCGLFWFLTLLAYGEFALHRKPSLYIAALFCFVLGLMAKPMIVTLPVIMLLMDYWPVGRFRHHDGTAGLYPVSMGTLLKEKLPFLAGSLISCAITIYAQQKEGSLAYFQELPFWMRFKNAIVSYALYLGKTVWPRDLAVYYPYPSTIPTWKFVAALSLLLVVSAAVWNWRRRAYLVTGWAWFLVSLLPVIGLIQVGNQAMADRYSYLPIIGLFIMVAWGGAELVDRLPHGARLLGLSAGIAVAVSTALTWQQIGYWRDSIALFRHTLAVTNGNAFIHYNLGLTLHLNDELDAAIIEYGKALEISPGDKDIHNALAIALQSKGRLDEALREYGRALQIDPNDMGTRNNLGLLLMELGDLDAAIREFRIALSLNPGSRNAAENLARAMAAKERRGDRKDN